METVSVKQEPNESPDIETKILRLCQENPKGISDVILQHNLPNIDAAKRVEAINKLLTGGKIDVLRSGNQLVYRAKDPEAAGKVKGSDNQERMVYQIIEEAGNTGIWIRDIRYKTNLLLPQLSKILKSLETKKIIKAVKSVSASKKKVYMLFDLEPDRSVTGGAWYSDQDFESEFVDVLNQQCFKFLEQRAAVARETKTDPIAQRNASFTPVRDVWKYISELGISKVQLSVEDIAMILNTLVFDGKCESTVAAAAAGSEEEDGQVRLFRAVLPLTEPTGLMRTPCGVCPVFHNCYEGGEVSPTKCVYMKDWLEF